MASSLLVLAETLPTEIRAYHQDVTDALSALYHATVAAAAAERELAQATAEAKLEIRKRITEKKEKATESSIASQVTLDPRVALLSRDAEQARHAVLRAKLDVERLDATRRMLGWLVNLSLAPTRPTEIEPSL